MARGVTSGLSELATRLYRGEAGFNIVGKRKIWYSVTATIILVAILSLSFRGFKLGIDFAGGNSFQIPASVGTLDQASKAIGDAGGTVVTTQRVGGSGSSATYLVRTAKMTAEQEAAVKVKAATSLGIDPSKISDDRVSAAWGSQITTQALKGVIAFLILVVGYLILAFREWRMAAAAIASLTQNLLLTAGIYSLVGFEVTPNTVIGFLTILGFALYDVVVVFDKVRENTRGLTNTFTTTYEEAANLALNQTLMRSINTALVALLPVGGLLFIGAGLLGAGTLKDLGLVLFVGMLAAVYSSIFLATPVLVDLKNREPAIAEHTRRVLDRRRDKVTGQLKAAKSVIRPPRPTVAPNADGQTDAEPAGVLTGAAVAPRVGAKPTPAKATGAKPNPAKRPATANRQAGRPGGGKRRH